LSDASDAGFWKAGGGNALANRGTAELYA
jgi:hypothetical protein